VTAATSHPAHDQLVRFGRGLLPAEDRPAVEAHVATCDECTARLTALDADSLGQLLLQAPQPAACPNSTMLPHSLGGATSPFTGLPSPAEVTPEGEGPGIIPEPLREHPRYRVLRLLGRGGMGNVYLAEHRHMGRLVALKVIDPSILDNPAAVRRFRQEVKAAAQLSHPNVVQAHDAEEAGGLHFLVLEYVEGQQLAAYAASGPLPYQEACEYARQAALGLQYAHGARLVHRDVKPHNLMVTPDGRVKVLDFGLARVLARPAAAGASATQAGMLMGTPDYVAPEQARDAGAVDGRADVYSLGCTLYHLLTGRPPFPGGTPVEKVARHLTVPVPALDAARLGLPAGLAEVVARMTARALEQRYQTAGEAAAALAPFAVAGSTPREAARAAAVPLAPTAPEREAAPRPDATVVEALPRGSRGRGRGPWGRVAVLAMFFGFVALAGVVVYRILTDNGELVIQTTDDDVEVVVKEGGKLVTIYDPKSGQKLVLRSGTYELELKGKPTGLKLDLDNVTLRRNDVKIAKIVRVPLPDKKNPPGQPAGKAKPPPDPPRKQEPETPPYAKDIGMEFVRIEPGTFRMGSPATELQRDTSPPYGEAPHQVTLTKGYRMSATLVTQYQWEQVMGPQANHSKFLGKDKAEKKQLPVDSVSWYDCVEFCNELSKKDKMTPCYALANVQRDGDGRITSADVTALPDGTGYRLPTEAEWEYAARAGTKTAFWWGDSITPRQANYNGHYLYGGQYVEKGIFRGKTTSVTSFDPNPWGLYDMGGNLYQWCQDYWGPYDSGDVEDPVRLQKADGDGRVLRGGSWNHVPANCRAARRGSNAPAIHVDFYGCRVVLCLD
jgi:formylglycine-generating enzyme required for sulfatase activity